MLATQNLHKTINLKHICRHPLNALHTTSIIGQQQQRVDSSSSSKKPDIVLIDAVRTPFVQSNTVFRELLAVDLQRHALKG
jgi:hypothetical protein